MQAVLLVGLGGFLGAVSRYSIGLWLSPVNLLGLYWGTLSVNLLGAFLLGVLTGLAQAYIAKDHPLMLLFAVGFCGSFTTFSTFAGELFTALQAGNWLTAGLYVGVSLVLGVLLFGTGVWLGQVR